MEDISAEPVPQQRRDLARREREARALEIVKRIGQPDQRPAMAAVPRPAKPEAEEPLTGEVYFLYACNRIKIGFSRRPEGRMLIEIAPYCPAPLFLIGTIPGNLTAERRMHSRFEDDRADAEWFTLNHELREFLCEDEDRSRKLTAAEDFYFEWLQAELAIQRENPVNEFAETRTMLKKLAVAHGAETAIGRACHNLLEQTENYAKTTDFDQRVQLKANINREMARLNDLVSQLH
jgi:hypothetical protein